MEYLLHIFFCVTSIIGVFSILSAFIPNKWEGLFMTGLMALINFVGFNFWHAENK